MEVKVLLDSINPYTGTRLTTLHCVYPQFLHQQILTHRMFSRNSSSLRAISYKRSLDFPIVYPEWTLEKKGMQGDILDDVELSEKAKDIVYGMFRNVLNACNELDLLGIHHQDINNYLRPFQNIHTVLSFTDINNFFEQRLHESTKPDMQILARLIYAALLESEPIQKIWHIPFCVDGFDFQDTCLISAARLARISYFKWQDDPQKDLELAKKLVRDKHLSPFEHIAFAQTDNQYYANFKSWKQLRHLQT